MVPTRLSQRLPLAARTGPPVARGAILLVGLAATTPGAAAPTKGSHYMVDGRCVTITRISRDQASYSWKEQFASGGGTLMLSDLTETCSGKAAPRAAESPPPPADPPPAAAGTTAPAAGSTTTPAAFAKEILDAHNHYRCMHGVPPLQWNAEVAAYAQKWANGLRALKHSNAYKSAIGPMGENLYGASGMEATGADATHAWYGEIKSYNYGTRSGGQSGHFTAMMWKDIKYLGCGRAHGIIACNYWSGTKASDCTVPNMPDCFRQQVLRPSKDAAACK